MKTVHVSRVANASAPGLHDGRGACIGGTLLDHAQLGGGAWRFVDWWRVPPGHSIGQHRHAHGRELYVVLSGQATLFTNGVAQPVKAGDLILNEPGDRHRFENTSEADVEILVTAVVDEPVTTLYENVP